MRRMIGACILALAIGGPSLAKDQAGEWGGMGFQRDDPGQPAESWTIHITVQADGHARIAYPSLGCSGTLTRIAGNDTRTEYRESITHGREHCVDGGIVGLVPRGARLFYYWVGEGSAEPDGVAVGFLERLPSR